MADWEEWVGNFTTLQQKAVEDNIARAFYGYLLARRSSRSDELEAFNVDFRTYDENDPKSFPADPYFKYETLEMVLNPIVKKKKSRRKKKKDSDDEEDESEEAESEDEESDDEDAEWDEDRIERFEKKNGYYTYGHAELKPVKDPANKKKNLKGEDGKPVKKLITGRHRVKRFATIGTDLKKYLLFILNKLVLELHKCFEDNKGQLDSGEKVLSQLKSYVAANYDQDGISPFIIDSGDLVPIEQYIDDEVLVSGGEKSIDLADYLVSRVAKCFKKGGKKGKRVSNAAFTEVVECYVNFLKVTALLLMDSIWGKPPGTLHIPAVEGVVRQMYMLMSSEVRGGHRGFQHEIYSSAAGWVEETLENAKRQKEENAAKRKRKKNDEDENEDDDEGVDDELEELEGDDDDDVDYEEE